MNVNVVCQEPKVLNSKKTKHCLELTLDFGPSGVASVVITRLKGGYQYEDKGYLVHFFDDPKAMVWEYELPKWILQVVQSLKPASKDAKENHYSVDAVMSAKGMAGMIVKTMGGN